MVLTHGLGRPDGAVQRRTAPNGVCGQLCTTVYAVVHCRWCTAGLGLFRSQHGAVMHGLTNNRTVPNSVRIDSLSVLFGPNRSVRRRWTTVLTRVPTMYQGVRRVTVYVGCTAVGVRSGHSVPRTSVRGTVYGVGCTRSVYGGVRCRSSLGTVWTSASAMPWPLSMLR